MESSSQFQAPAILGCLLLLVFFLLKMRRNTPKPPAAPPHPRKLPIIGNLHQLAGSSLPHRRFRDLANQYGAVMGLQLGQIPFVVISSAESAEQILKTHDVVLANRPFSLAAQILTYDFTDIIFSPYGAYWRQLRKICALELLNPNRVQSFGSIRSEEISNSMGGVSVSAGQEFNFSQMVFSLTAGIVSRVAFGKKYRGHDEFVPVMEEMARISGGFSLADLFPSVKLLQVMSGMRSQLLRLRNEADRMMDGIISDHRERQSTADQGSDEVDDLVDVLLKLQAGGGLEVPLSDDNIKAVILDVFIAGSDTSAIIMDWAMSEMIKNPRILLQAQSEVRRVFKLKGDVDVTQLHELYYLQSVIKETLRLHPPGPLLIPRECGEDCEIDGFQVKAKEKAIVNIWAISRDPKYWNDPEEFRPERFVDNPIDFKGSNFEFLPFGSGRRICPGIAFSMANIELSLANFLYHFDWELPSDVKIENLDMTELYGFAVRKKHNLKVIPIPYTKH
ncbi:unnamed protein product [Linum tenue]|uniref:Cytochrome P450 n=1 Tax=Linum tenue TaxID=586396 RepID=A0AAV0GMZ3_9ROSI|nr:unnamed protein product [Linum tenue]